MTKKEYLTKASTTKIIYYCNNHLLNTQTKKLLFKGNACNGKIKFDRQKQLFYITHSHNAICNNNNPKIYDNIGEIQTNVYEFSNFKKDLINYLNRHHMITFKDFKIKANDYFLKNNFDFFVKKNTYANIYYPWRNNSKIFSWYSIFDNPTTNDNKTYLKDVSIKLYITTNIFFN
jgi:hypothetical protein